MTTTQITEAITSTGTPIVAPGPENFDRNGARVTVGAHRVVIDVRYATEDDRAYRTALVTEALRSAGVATSRHAKVASILYVAR